MSTNVSGVSTNFFTSPQNGFTTTTSGSVASAAATVGLNSVAGYSNGDVDVWVIDPTDTNKKQSFTGVVDTAGSQVTSVKWTAGTNQTHALGATVVAYTTATHQALMTKGLLVSHSQTGAITTDTIAEKTAAAGVTIDNLNIKDGLAADGASHIAYTPTISAGSGSFTTASATGRYTRYAKTIFYEVIVTITTKGTGSEVRFSLPYTPAQSNYVTAFGREDGATGKMVQGKPLGGSAIALFFYDGTATGGDGHVYRVNGWFEVA